MSPNFNGCLEGKKAKTKGPCPGFIRCPGSDAFALASGASTIELLQAQDKQRDYIDKWRST